MLDKVEQAIRTANKKQQEMRAFYLSNHCPCSVSRGMCE